MSPINVELLSKTYLALKAGLGKGKDAAITAAVVACGIPDSTGFVAWVIGKILDRCGLDVDSTALAIAIVLEYAIRENSISKGIHLQNQCSVCHCKGHNVTNHSSDMDKFLKASKMLGRLQDVTDLIGASGF